MDRRQRVRGLLAAVARNESVLGVRTAGPETSSYQLSVSVPKLVVCDKTAAACQEQAIGKSCGHSGHPPPGIPNRTLARRSPIKRPNVRGEQNRKTAVQIKKRSNRPTGLPACGQAADGSTALLPRRPPGQVGGDGQRQATQDERQFKHL